MKSSAWSLKNFLKISIFIHNHREIRNEDTRKASITNKTIVTLISFTRLDFLSQTGRRTTRNMMKKEVKNRLPRKSLLQQ